MGSWINKGMDRVHHKIIIQSHLPDFWEPLENLNCNLYFFKLQRPPSPHPTAYTQITVFLLSIQSQGSKAEGEFRAMEE